jgi:hypothetical protein
MQPSGLDKEEARFKMLHRISQSPDGPDLLEYLGELSKINYDIFKKCAPHTSDYCKGYAVCVDSLIEAIEDAPARLMAIANQREQEAPLPTNTDAPEDEGVNPHG